MSDNSKIEWTNATWPVVTGCDYASPGCANCYAVRDARRLSGNPNAKVSAAYAGVVERRGEKLRWTGRVNCLDERLDWPLHWRKPRKVFVCNESDLFHPDVPTEFIGRVFNIMAAASQHTFQVLTKRPERMRDVVTAYYETYDSAPWALPNVWLGVSVENQRFLERIDVLKDVPAAVRFVSFEPLIEHLGALVLDGIDWAIVGGESGPGARPCDVAWVRSVVSECRRQGVWCFVKQLGANVWHTIGREQSFERAAVRDRKGGDMAEWPADLRVREFPV